MADIVFVGDAAAVQQVSTGTLDTYDAATTYTVTINGKSISTVGTGGTTSTTATALRALLNAATAPPEFLEITWSGATNAIIGTADTAGKPFTAVLSVSGGTGTRTDFSTTTANAGPNVCAAANFKDASSGARTLPADGDTLYFQDCDVDLLYSLDALTSVTPAATHIKASYTGTIGLPFLNSDGATDYAEYRERFFFLDGSTLLVIGQGDGEGSDRLQINLKAAVASAITVHSTGTASDDYHALIIKGTHASNTLTVLSGEVDLAPFDDDAATIATLLASGDAEVRCNPNCTLTTITASGAAQVEINSAATTINCQDSATVTRLGSGAVTTANIALGTFNDKGSGTITNVYVGDGAIVDNTDSAVGKTYTNTTVAGNFTINDPGHKVTFTNAIDPGKGSVFDGTLELGNARTILPGAP